MNEVFVAIGTGAVGLALFALFALPVMWVIGRVKAARPRSNARVQPSAQAEFAAALMDAGAREVRGSFVITRDGVETTFTYVANSEAPSEIHVSQSIAPGGGMDALPELPALTLREENSRDRLGKSLGLNRELQTGDALFDERVYIECDSSAAAARLMALPRVRAGVVSLLAAGHKVVGFRLHGQALVTTWQVSVRPFDRPAIEASIAGLGQITAALPPFRAVPTKRKLSRGALAVVSLWILAGLAFAVFIGTQQEWTPLRRGLGPLTLGVSGLVLGLELALAWFLVRGRAQALRHLVLAALAGVVLAPCLGRAAVVTYNGAGDQPTTSYTRPLLHKHISRGDDSDSYYLHFAALPGMQDTSAVISVRAREYNLAQLGDPYVVTIGPGRLGVPWLQSLQRL